MTQHHKLQPINFEKQIISQGDDFNVKNDIKYENDNRWE